MQCCSLTFTRATVPRDMTIGNEPFKRGQDIWVAEEYVEVSGQCVKLAGILAPRESIDDKDRLRICNCPDLCWLEGKLYNDDEDTQRDHFKAELPACCECWVKMLIEPCCQPADPVILSATEDCYGVSEYNLCDPPTQELADGTVKTGLCYKRGKEVSVTYPGSISCNQTLYFAYAEITVCGTTTTSYSPAIEITIPGDASCLDPCEITVKAFYDSCCQCGLEVRTMPCDYNEPIGITEDCYGRTSVTPTYAPNPPLCYQYSASITINQFPASLTCNGRSLGFSHVIIEYCDGTTERQNTQTVSFDMPSVLDCNQSNCWARVTAYYEDCPCEVRLEMDPCSDILSAVTHTADCDNETTYDFTAPPSSGYPRYEHEKIVSLTFPLSVECGGEQHYIETIEVSGCAEITHDYTLGSSSITIVTPSRGQCPGECYVHVKAVYKPCCQCVLELATDPCMNGTVSFTPSDCNGLGSINLATASYDDMPCYFWGSTVTVTFPAQITCDGEPHDFTYAIYEPCGDIEPEGPINTRTIAITLPNKGDGCGACRVRLKAFYGAACPNGFCDELNAGVGAVSFQLDTNTEIACGDSDCRAGACQSCWAQQCELNRNLLSGLQYVVDFYGSDLCFNRGRYEHYEFCATDGDCDIYTFLETDVRTDFSWRWRCDTGETRLRGSVSAAAHGSLRLVNREPYFSCVGYCGDGCTGGGVSGIDHVGSTHEEWVTIGTFTSLQDAIEATKDYINRRTWEMGSLSGKLSVT